MDRDKETFEKAAEYLKLAQNGTLTPKEVEEFLTTLLKVIEETGSQFSKISQENQEKIDYALEAIENWSQGEFKKKIDEIRAIAAIKPKDGYTPQKDLDYFDGKDADPNVVAPIAAKIAADLVKSMIPKAEDLKGFIPDEDSIVEKLKKFFKDFVTKKDLEEVKKIAQAAGRALPITTTFFSRDGLNYGRAKNVNMIGSKVEVTGDQVNITPVVVSDTEPDNPFLNQLWVDTS